MTNEAITTAQRKMDETIKVFERDLGSIRAGVANASLLEGVQVDYYGAPTPLTQLSSVTIPEPRVLLITPYDQSSLENIEHAILAANLGLTPANDGKVIRLVIPQLTSERRQEIAKEVGKVSERAKIALRNVRQESMKSLKKQQKDNEITEDDEKRLEKDLQKVTDDSTKRVDQLADEKRKEITQG